jgi:tRNA(Arg) A34 adenosine deaminase TadA
MLDDEAHMRRAIELTANCPTLPFGAVVVHRGTGEILAAGWNRAEENPLLHGEVVALTAAAALRLRPDGRDLVLYATAEPCPMCMWTVPQPAQLACHRAGAGSVTVGTGGSRAGSPA